jgi:DNA-directed RNA polymerase specialized sigma24 family protein
VEVSLADYLADNPGKTEDDFRALKELSDGIYFEQDRAENAQTKKNSPLDETDESALCQEPSPEERFIGEIDAQEEAERYQERLTIANRALDKLTEVQRRRYLQYRVEGLSARDIAEIEGTNHKSVLESLWAAEKKIKKVLESN